MHLHRHLSFPHIMALLCNLFLIILPGVTLRCQHSTSQVLPTPLQTPSPVLTCRSPGAWHHRQLPPPSLSLPLCPDWMHDGPPPPAPPTARECTPSCTLLPSATATIPPAAPSQPQRTHSRSVPLISPTASSPSQSESISTPSPTFTWRMACPILCRTACSSNGCSRASSTRISVALTAAFPSLARSYALSLLISISPTSTTS